jgi:hypothetical protein
MKQHEMTKILTMFFPTFWPSMELTQETMKMWFKLFEGEDAHTFCAAMKSAVLEPGRAFPPAPGEVQKYLTKALATPEDKLTASEAWGKVLTCASRSLSRFQMEKSLNEFPRAVKAALQVGYERIRFSDTEKELPFVRKDFVRYYEEMKDRDTESSQVRLGNRQSLPEPARELLKLAKAV